MAGKATIPSPASGELYYRIPEDAHEELGQIRDELGMLAHLAMRDCCERGQHLQLSTTALAQCFARLAVELTEVIECCLSPADYGASTNRSRH